MLRNACAPALLTAGMALAVLPNGCGGPRSPRFVPGPADVETPRGAIAGTIRTVQPARRMLEVLTGRGLVIEAMEFRVPESVPIIWHGEEVQLTAMVPGYIVRIQYRRTESGMVAERIEEIGDANPPPERPGSRFQ